MREAPSQDICLSLSEVYFNHKNYISSWQYLFMWGLYEHFIEAYAYD
jgi:hypothetical protein